MFFKTRIYSPFNFIVNIQINSRYKKANVGLYSLNISYILLLSVVVDSH